VVSLKLREAVLEIVAEAKDSGFDVVVVVFRGLGEVRELFWGILVRRCLI
jgi:hypothetical protein